MSIYQLLVRRMFIWPTAAGLTNLSRCAALDPTALGLRLWANFYFSANSAALGDSHAGDKRSTDKTEK